MTGNKSLGKNLVNISRTFMTREEESAPDESSPIFLSTPVREASCSACINVIEEPPDTLKCKIFSFQNKEHGGLFLKTIMPGYAKYCRYFEPPAPHKAGIEPNAETIESDSTQYNMEVEETIDSRKRIVFKDGLNLQENFKNMLTQHIEKGYEIVRIDLEKKEENKDPGCSIKRYEKVTLLKNNNQNP